MPWIGVDWCWCDFLLGGARESFNLIYIQVFPPLFGSFDPSFALMRHMGGVLRVHETGAIPHMTTGQTSASPLFRSSLLASAASNNSRGAKSSPYNTCVLIARYAPRARDKWHQRRFQSNHDLAWRIPTLLLYTEPMRDSFVAYVACHWVTTESRSLYAHNSSTRLYNIAYMRKISSETERSTASSQGENRGVFGI